MTDYIEKVANKPLMDQIRLSAGKVYFSTGWFKPEHEITKEEVLNAKRDAMETVALLENLLGRIQ